MSVEVPALCPQGRNLGDVPYLHLIQISCTHEYLFIYLSIGISMYRIEEKE